MKNKYEIVDELIYISLKDHDEVLYLVIDKEDFDLINNFENTWKPNIKNGKVRPELCGWFPLRNKVTL